MATLKDIARKAGVSVGTVSRVINNSPHVSDRKRDIVLGIMEELDYQPNLMAQILSRKRPRTAELGLVVTGIDNPANVSIVKGATEEAAKYGYVVMFCTAWHTKEIKKYLDGFVRRQVEGVAIASYMDARSLVTLSDLQTKGVPLAVCRDAAWPVAKDDHAFFKQLPVATVDFDSVNTCEQAVRYLIELGHKRIAAITGNAELHGKDPRLLGYRQALEKAGMAYDPKLLYAGAYDTVTTGFAAMQEILTSCREVTAIFGFNDMLALGAIRALQDAGIRVPEDFSVIGFDNSLIGSYTNPTLSTINVPKYEIGQALIRSLIGVIQGTELRHEVLNTNFVVRQSTGFAPGKSLS
ncbi:MAG TPA: LacI family DNA-binding transcriptional regulator [Bacillota bacterium]|nr:LacI family DNA-binding transcriptional regulator [Bacillota bacterium]